MANVKKNILRALGASSFGTIVTTINQLLFVPLFISNWGVNLYGEWLIITSIPTMIASNSDLGFAMVTANEMSMKTSRGDKIGALVSFQSTWIFISVLSLFFLSLFWLIIKIHSIDDLFKINIISSRDTVQIILFLMIKILLMQQLSLLFAAYRCDGNYALSLFLNNCIRLFEVIMIGVLLLFSFSPVSIALSMMLLTLLSVITIKIHLSFLSPWIKYGFGYYKINEVKRLFPAAISYISFPITNALNIQGLILIIGAALSSQAVVLFNTTRTLFNLIKQVINAFNYSILSELSTAFGNNNIEIVKKIYKVSVQIYIILCLSFFIFMLFTGEIIYQYWTGNVMTIDRVFFYSLLGSTTLGCLWHIGWVIIVSSNKHAKLSIVNLFASCLSIGITYSLIKETGLIAVVLGFITMDIILITFVTRKTLGVIQENLYGFLQFALTDWSTVTAKVKLL